MTYDFNTPVNRRNTCSYKWDSAENPEVLPMWVADMDFRTAPCIINALKQRVEHGIFGYTRVPDEYYDAVISWFKRRHNWTIDRSLMIYTSGVVPAISAVIKALASPGDKILVQTPVYNCFFSSIRNNGCEILSNPLVRKADSYVIDFDDLEQKAADSYVIDFDDLEQKAADSSVKVMLLCNPHNPAGRVWTPEELRLIGDICIKHGVTVISDEIHGELAFPQHPYTPFASISEDFRANSVTCISPSKAFNIAGLQIANIVAGNQSMRDKIDKAININEVCDVNPFGVAATIAAYNEGEEWLTQLISYFKGNYEYFREYCNQNLPEFPITKLEGTYLVWMDCSHLNIPSEKLEHLLLADANLWLNAGTMYGDAGEGFMRWNIACLRTTLIDGLNRFSNFIRS